MALLDEIRYRKAVIVIENQLQPLEEWIAGEQCTIEQLLIFCYLILDAVILAHESCL